MELNAVMNAQDYALTKSNVDAFNKTLDSASAGQTLEKDDFLTDLLKLKEQDGRDNALIHYQQASHLMPGQPDKNQSQLIKKTLKDGWTAEAEALLPLLNTYQPMLAEIRKGTALNYARNLGLEKGINVPMPKFLAAQTASKMLCVEGRQLESQGRHDEALNNYLAVLTMGRDFSAPGGTLISNLISYLINQIAVGQIQDLARSGKLSRDWLLHAINYLEAIEETEGTIKEAFSGESQCFGWVIDDLRKRLRTNPAEAQKVVQELYPHTEKDLQGLTPQQIDRIKPENILKELDRMEEEKKRYWDVAFQCMDTPYWTRDFEVETEKLQAMLDSFHPLAKNGMPSILEFQVRYLRMIVDLRKAKLVTALALFQLDKEAYPKSLTEIVPAYLPQMPVDPFSGEAFRYQSQSGGRDYSLYSVGPDRADQQGATLYDPTNGTVSAGDIFRR